MVSMTTSARSILASILLKATDGVVLEAEGLVEAGVDPLDRGAAVVGSLPGRAVTRSRGEDPTVEVERDSDDGAEVGG